MFSVKISYHHQRRLAIHYRVEALLNDSWVASPAENPLLSAWSSLVWRWTLSTQGFFEANLCCNSSFGRASARSSFINRAEEEYSKIQHHFHQHLKNSTSISPPPAFLSMRPSWEQPKAALRVPLGSEVGGKGWGCAHPTLCSKISPQPWFCEIQPIWAQILNTHILILWFIPLTPPGSFSDATKLLFFDFKMDIFSV